MDYDIRNSTTPISTSSYNTGEEDITWKTPIASRNHMIMHEGSVLEQELFDQAYSTWGYLDYSSYRL